MINIYPINNFLKLTLTRIIQGNQAINAWEVMQSNDQDQSAVYVE